MVVRRNSRSVAEGYSTMKYSTEEHTKKIELLARMIDKGDASNKDLLLQMTDSLTQDMDFLDYFVKEAGSRVKIVQSTLGHLEEYKLFAYVQDITLELLGVPVVDFFDFDHGIYAVAQKLICYFIRDFLGASTKMISSFMCVEPKKVTSAICYVDRCFKKEIAIEDMQGKRYSMETISAWVSKKLEIRLNMLDL